MTETATPTPNNLCFDPLRKELTLESLKTLLFIVETSIGPHGKLKVLQNATGGAVIATSSSHRLFHHISVKNIISKIIISAAKSHLQIYGDGGLYCVLLTLKSIFNCLSFDHLPLLGATFNCFANLYKECLLSERNLCVINIDLSHVRHLRCLVYTLLSSKPACTLTHTDKNYLCNLLLKTFLKAIPSTNYVLDSFANKFTTVEGVSVKHSRLFEGVVLPISSKNDVKRIEEKCSTGLCKVALFTSLSGELELPTYNIETNDKFSVSDVILSKLHFLVEKLISENVHFLFCQKVIHPRFKKLLQDSGVLAIDRLGSESMRWVQYISGCTANSSLVCEISYGHISSYLVERIGKKWVLILCNDDIPFSSVMLCSYSEESATELKVVCQQVMDTLTQILKNPKVCFGGGCTETHTLHLLANKVREISSSIQNDLECNTSHVKDSFSSFSRSILNVAVAVNGGNQLDFITEETHGHLWKLRDGNYPAGDDRCVCGHCVAQNVASWMVLSDVKDSSASFVNETINDNDKMIILDALDSKMNSTSLAIETASTLLQTSILINNVP